MFNSTHNLELMMATLLQQIQIKNDNLLESLQKPQETSSMISSALNFLKPKVSLPNKFDGMRTHY